MNGRRAWLGLAFVAILVAGAGLSVLAYDKAFTPAVRVTLRVDRVGLQLNQGAEVKLRDVVVGTVREIVSDGSTASLRLDLDPALTSFIPRNVRARLLPRTLFGERFVALTAPSDAVAQPIRDGDVITQDRSSTAIELEQVIDDSLQLLQKVKVDKLAATLNALAVALDGRGERLGQDIKNWDAYLSALNETMPTIDEDLTLLAQLLSTFDGATPDLLAFLRDVTVTATTLSQQRTELHQFLTDVTQVADVARTFLDDHGDQLIRFGEVSAPFARLLATYAPTYPCVLGAIVGLQDRASRVFANRRMTVTQYAFGGAGYPGQREYRPGDEPVYGERNRPDCRRLDELRATPVTNDPGPARPPRLADGFEYGGAAALVRDPSIGLVGSFEERSLVRATVAASTGTNADDVGDLAVLLWSPILRGGVVNLA